MRPFEGLFNHISSDRTLFSRPSLGNLPWFLLVLDVSARLSVRITVMACWLDIVAFDLSCVNLSLPTHSRKQETRNPLFDGDRTRMLLGRASWSSLAAFFDEASLHGDRWTVEHTDRDQPAVYTRK